MKGNGMAVEPPYGYRLEGEKNNKNISGDDR